MNSSIRAAQEEYKLAKDKLDLAVQRSAESLARTLYLFCTKKPPIKMCEDWIRGEEAGGNDSLQGWVVGHVKKAFEHFYGIGIIEAAQHLLENKSAVDGSKDDSEDDDD